MILEKILGSNFVSKNLGISGRNFIAIENEVNNYSQQINNLATKVVWKALDYKLEVDKPSAYPDQQTTIFVATQVWQGVSNLIIKTEKYNNNIAIQYLQPNGNLILPIMYRLAIPNTDTWSSWKKILTNTQPDWITGTLQSGWNGILRYAKNDLGQVTLMASIIPGTLTFNTILSNLPEGYRPINIVPILVYNSNTGTVLTGIVLTKEGNLLIYKPASDGGITTSNTIHFLTTYQAG